MAYTKKTAVAKTPTATATTVLEDTSPVLPLPDTPQGVMAVGPRVTFRFVQEYDQENSYDYYDVVNVDGTSYIAINNVPANTPITDADYWVKWNDPNAQFALLQGTVNQFETRLDNVDSDITGIESDVAAIESRLDAVKRMLVFGDSWANPTTNYYYDWDVHVAARLGVTSSNYGDGGSRMTNDPSMGTANSIEAQVDEAIAAHSAHASDVLYCVILGGVNDFGSGYTASNYTSHCTTIYNKLKAAFPTAKIVHFQNMCLFDGSEENATQALRCGNFIRDYFTIKNNLTRSEVYNTDLVFPLINSTFYLSDSLHLSSAGNDVREAVIYSVLAGVPLQQCFALTGAADTISTRTVIKPNRLQTMFYGISTTGTTVKYLDLSETAPDIRTILGYLANARSSSLVEQVLNTTKQTAVLTGSIDSSRNLSYAVRSGDAGYEGMSCEVSEGF